MIIGITGYARHGKNTVGRILEENYGFKQVALADKVREFAIAVDPMIRLDGNSCVRIFTILADGGWEQAKEFPDVRRLLQRIGTEGGRGVLGEDVWINALFPSLEDGKNYVITDVRFPNEATRIKSCGGQMWRVYRPGFDNGVGTNHPSEAHIADIPTDRVILNDGSEEDLVGVVVQAVYHSGIIMNGLEF